MIRLTWSTRTSGRAASMPISASGTTSFGSLMSFFIAATLAAARPTTGSRSQVRRPLLFDTAVLPDGHGDQPGKYEQKDNRIANVVQIDVRYRGERPGGHAGLLGQD